MKKRLFWILAFISLLICILSACGRTSSNDVDKAALEMSNFKYRFKIDMSQID